MIFLMSICFSLWNVCLKFDLLPILLRTSLSISALVSFLLTCCDVLRVLNILSLMLSYFGLFLLLVFWPTLSGLESTKSLVDLRIFLIISWLKVIALFLIKSTLSKLNTRQLSSRINSCVNNLLIVYLLFWSYSKHFFKKSMPAGDILDL